ncbi:RagB/SusD family nutrient uptake outer membrane protein [Dysgonomonas sp. Marseille-P4677]|uniref:RagB/SusD family nutrient uptake outer membrane protein n=1 Tax=Dysgonomonas sp. Marseille-P4677 TaxID=2364790 RepID=UPI0019126FFD|nr:RagB/SusD family nutrient uptake outer membrane protein [Dysgonomonas sp. Marseille-P4677]MBK5721774.1 RagB/SusD family nutrient uptake outer membrane protein [Dysgonomonas sp. Marseille-P4677]
MKKIILSIIISLGIFSCSDFIEHDQRGTQNLDNYFATAEECEYFVNSLYSSLLHYDWYQLIAPRLANETATDDAWMGNTGQDASGFQPAAQYLITPNRMGYLNTLFKIRYENIAACNIGIYGIQSAPISEALKSQYIGEALFMRAYNYYDLVNNFGGVPLVLETLTPSQMDKERESKETIYAQIESDLINAAARVKTSYDASDKGRVTKWACYGLLARVSLFQNKWEKAYHYADTLITNSSHALESDFINIWNVNNPNGIESILEAQTSSVSDKSLGNQMCTFTGARGEKKENFPSNSPDDVMDGWGWCTPTSDLENCYISEGDDIRRKSTITVYGEPAYGDEVLNPTHIFDLEQNKSGRIIRKFYIPIATRRILEDKYANAPLNSPILRLAEVYLTRAEAAYHLNNVSKAMDDVDIIRARVNLPAKKGTISGKDVLRAIWKERRMELAFEGLRLFDIRRQIDPDTNKPVIDGLFGTNGSFVKYNTTKSTDQYETTNKKELQDKGVNFDLNKHMVWPIPQSEIDRSSGKIQQNPNY